MTANSTLFNDSLLNNIYGNKCFGKMKLTSFSNSSNFDYKSCPDRYTNSTERIIIYCCIEIIIKEIENSVAGKLQHWLAYYSSSILFLPAIFFNLFTLLILSRFSRLNSIATTINYYMKYLCIFDTLTIMSKFMYEYVVVRNVIRKNPFKLNSMVCKLTHFTESAFGIASIYLLVLMSIDKLFYVAFPLKVASYLKPRRAKLFSALTFLFSIFYSSHHLFNQQVRANQKNVDFGHQCSDNSIFEKQMALVDLVIRIFLPISLLCLLNITIIILLAKPRNIMAVSTNKSIQSTVLMNRTLNLTKDKGRNSIQKPNSILDNFKVSQKVIKESINNQNKFSIDRETNEFDKVNLNIKSATCLYRYFYCFNHTSRQDLRKSSAVIKKSSNKIKNKFHYTSVMLLTVTFGFVIFNLPYAIKTLYELKFSEKFISISSLIEQDENVKEFTKDDLMKVYNYELMVYISHFLLDLNYVSNFFFYFLSGSRFRNRVRNFMCLKFD
jgi:hypothetical protein